MRLGVVFLISIANTAIESLLEPWIEHLFRCGAMQFLEFGFFIIEAEIEDFL